jgi:hypothetical protein
MSVRPGDMANRMSRQAIDEAFVAGCLLFRCPAGDVPHFDKGRSEMLE